MSDTSSPEPITVKRGGFMLAGAASVAAIASARRTAQAQVSSGCAIDSEGHIDIAPIDASYYTPKRFAGKVLLITGCATGIGAASAMRAAREGAAIVGCDLKREQLHATIDAIAAEGHRAVAVVGHVADDRTCDEMVRAAVERFGGLDGALNAAGVIDGGEMHRQHCSLGV